MKSEKGLICCFHKFVYLSGYTSISCYLIHSYFNLLEINFLNLQRKLKEIKFHVYLAIELFISLSIYIT